MYTTQSQVWALDGLGDVETFTPEMVDEAIAFAEARIDDYTGTSWEHRAHAITLSGNGRTEMRLETEQGEVILFPREITSISVDGVDQDVTDFRLLVEGWVRWHHGTSPDYPGTFDEWAPVEIELTAGATATPPVDIVGAARSIARAYLLGEISRVPDQTLSIQSDFGQIQMATPNDTNRPTNMPSVNTVLNQHRHRAPRVR